MDARLGSGLVALLGILALPQSAAAQADSALVARILLAEDQRDSSALALGEGLRSSDPRIHALAARALARIGDPVFARRDSMSGERPAAPPAWTEPAWRLRLRSLATQRDDCAALRAAAADESWPVRLRVAALARQSCANDEALLTVFSDWARSLPADVTRRERDSVSWHGASHGLVAFARLRPAEALELIRVHAWHRDWHVRQYAARAAVLASDTTTLRSLVSDGNDNVKEAAIEGLVRLTGHTDDALFLAALESNGAQAVLAAAKALKGSTTPEVRDATQAAFHRFISRANASERDVRIALLEVLGRPASDDLPGTPDQTLPRDAVALALGATVHLRVTMDASAGGGGSFLVRLRGDVAPLMAARILELVRVCYYDGLSWHRVEHDFVVQGGSTGDNEYVGLGHYLIDELSTVPHVRGTIGMSTRGHDTGDAQWFINLRDNVRLGRDYTIFAEVVEGIEVVDRVMEGDVIATIREVPR